MKKKPSCNEFIVAAIRYMRREPLNLKAGSAAGINALTVFKVASEIYTHEKIKDSINSLLENYSVIAVANVGGSRLRRVFSISCLVPNDTGSRFHVDAKGILTCEDENSRKQPVLRLMLFVAEDGLPVTVQKFAARPSSLAEKIIDSIKLEKKQS